MKHPKPPDPVTHILTMHVTEKELEQIHRYGRKYGSGGFQGLINRLLQRSLETRILPLAFQTQVVRTITRASR